MLQVYREVFNGEPIMIPCSSHLHAIQVTEMYRAEGWKVEHIHSKLNKYDRKRIINAIRKKKINILTTYAVGTEGLDIRGLAGVIWMRFTESLTVWIQMNTRAARIDKGKKFYILVDPMGNTVLHGRPDIDRKHSLDTDYVPGQDVVSVVENHICPVCGVMNDHLNNACWICGYNFITGLLDGKEIDKKKRKLPRFIEGELVFLDEKENDNGNGITGRLKNNDSDSGNNVGGMDNNIQTIELTKSQKVEILSRNLTGIRMKNKFKEGIKWL
jgi:superfamily II DNA or RNA helicase